MNRSLDSDCYLAALSIALMLPDICGKAEFPNKKVFKRYIKWYDEHIGKYEEPQKVYENDMPYLSGEVVYNLRNAFFHQGTPNIDSNKIKQERNKIYKFELVFEKKNKYNIYVDSGGLINDTFRTYRLNVRNLCLVIGKVAGNYYNNNKEKFNFFQYTIINWNEEMDKMKKLGF